MSNSQLSFNQLAGGDVLKQTMRVVYGKIARRRFNMGEYRTVAELATVCRAWHRALSEHLYRQAIIGYVEVDGASDGIGRVKKYKIVSNIGAIITAGMSHYTKHIKIRSLMRPFRTPPLDRALESFGFGTVSWDAVKSISLSVMFRDSRGAPVDELAQKYADYLIQHLPGLTNIEGSISIYSPVTSGIYSRLLCHYMPQLSTLTIDKHLATYSLDNFSANLTNINLDARAIARVEGIPRVLAAPLRDMRTTNVNADFSWNLLASPTSGCLEFANLETLALSCQEGQIPLKLDSDQINATFPRLRNLTIGFPSAFFTDIYAVLRDSPLESISVQEDAGRLEKFDPRMVRNLTHFSLALGNGIPNLDDSWNLAISRLLAAESQIRTATLNLLPSPSPFTGSVNWRYLQRLDLEVMRFDWEGYERLISQLPCLKYLYIMRNKDEHDRERPAVPDEITSPISSSLEKLIIDNADFSMGRQLPWVRRLVLRVPSLMTLWIPPKDKTHFDEMAALYGRDIRINDSRYH